MKVGFVLDDSLDKTDGVQQYVLTLGRWLSGKGHEVHYLVGSTKRTDIPHLHSLSKNIQVHFNENRMSTPLPANRNKIMQLLSSQKFDILHVQMPYSPFLAGRIIKYSSPGTSVIGTFHIIPFSNLERMALLILNVFQRRGKRRFDEVFAVSKPAHKYAKRHGKSKTLVVPNVIEGQKYYRASRLKKYNDNKINIVFLGRLVERKGCMLLLKAIERLHRYKLLINVRVLICGKGPLRMDLEKYVYEKHLGSVVHFVGYIAEEDKPSYLASADIAVFPSTGGESFGIVLLEAMAAGSRVVLAGNNPGYSWVMKNTKDQLFNPKDTNQFANRLKHFILNAKAREQAEKWQKSYVKQFDVRVIGPDILGYYQRAIAKRRRN